MGSFLPDLGWDSIVFTFKWLERGLGADFSSASFGCCLEDGATEAESISLDRRSGLSSAVLAVVTSLEGAFDREKVFVVALEPGKVMQVNLQMSSSRLLSLMVVLKVEFQLRLLNEVQK